MMYEATYSSQSDRDTGATQFKEGVYAQNYASDLSNQNQYTTDYNSKEDIDVMTEDISKVNLTNDSLSHSHMVHTPHEHYPHQETFQTSQVQHLSSQQPSHLSHVSVYPQQQQWAGDHSLFHSQHNSQAMPINSHSTQVHTSSVHMPVNEQQSGSISVGHEETKQEVVETDQIQTNVLENEETEGENMVDFASYPPLQPTSNNIPIGASVIPDQTSEDTSEQDKLNQQEDQSGEQSGSVWGKPKSWANLFKGASSSTPSSVIYTNNENYIDIDYPTINQENDAKTKQAIEMSPVPAIHDSAADILGGKEFLN